MAGLHAPRVPALRCRLTWTQVYRGARKPSLNGRNHCLKIVGTFPGPFSRSAEKAATNDAVEIYCSLRFSPQHDGLWRTHQRPSSGTSKQIVYSAFPPQPIILYAVRTCRKNASTILVKLSAFSESVPAAPSICWAAVPVLTAASLTPPISAETFCVPWDA